MAKETLALLKQRPPQTGGDNEYQAFCAALGASARGRAFLAEYAKRNRNADTQVLLTALYRLEALMRVKTAVPDTGQIQQNLAALYKAIRSARADINDSHVTVRAVKFAALIEDIELYLGVMVAPAPETATVPDAGPPVNEPAVSGPLAASTAEPTVEPTAEAEPAHRAVVPTPIEPELPIPQPANDQPTNFALVQTVAKPMPGATQVAGSQPAGLNTDLTAAGPTPTSKLIPIPEVNFAGRAVAETAAMLAPAVESVRLETPMPVAPLEFAEPATAIVNQNDAQAVQQAVAPKAPGETYELWLDPPANPAIDFQADLQIDAQAIVDEQIPADAPIDRPAPAKPAALSPRQAAIAALAAQTKVQTPPQANPRTGPSSATQAGLAVSPSSAGQDAAPARDQNRDQDVAKPVVLSPRQAAIAALAAQAKTPITEQAQAPAELKVEAKAETKTERESETPQPAPVATPAQPVTDPLAAIMALSEDERLALFT